MKCILDTHFLLWIVLDVARLAELPWLKRYQPWGVSPVSLLEMQFLAEAGRLEVKMAELTTALGDDPRFLIDDVPFLNLIQQAIPLRWTRDPFDRLLAAHSAARRTPLCSIDREIRVHHPLIPRELRLAS